PPGDSHALILLASHHFDINDNPGDIIDGGMLLVGRLKSAIAAIRCHGRVGIGRADLLVFARLTPASFSFVAIGSLYRVNVAHGQCTPADTGADQGRSNMDDLPSGNLRGVTGMDCTLKYPRETFSTPSLTNAGQCRMIRQRLMQTVTDEPADCDVDRR